MLIGHVADASLRRALMSASSGTASGLVGAASGLPRQLIDVDSTPRRSRSTHPGGTSRDVNGLLVYTDSMSHEHGNVKSPGQMRMPEGHPTTTEVRVELEQTDSGTSMVLTHVGVAADSPGAAGWTIAIDKLS